MGSRRVVTVAALAGLCLAVGPPAQAAFFSNFLDGVVAALQVRSGSDTLDTAQERAVNKALTLAAREHGALSKDLKTAAKISKLAARKLAEDTELSGLIASALGAMEAAVLVNAADAGIVLASSGLSPLKQARWFARIAKPQATVATVTDPSKRAKLFAKSQAVIEKILAKFGT